MRCLYNSTRKEEENFDAYDWLTNQIKAKIKKKEIINYNSRSIQGKLHKKKDFISWEMVKKCI